MECMPEPLRIADQSFELFDSERVFPIRNLLARFTPVHSGRPAKVADMHEQDLSCDSGHAEIAFRPLRYSFIQHSSCLLDTGIGLFATGSDASQFLLPFCHSESFEFRSTVMAAAAIGSTVALPFNDNLGNTIPPDTPHVSFRVV